MGGLLHFPYDRFSVTLLLFWGWVNPQSQESRIWRTHRTLNLDFALWLISFLFLSSPDNFQDQMKRELAYREEMVQQLQIVRGISAYKYMQGRWFVFKGLHACHTVGPLTSQLVEMLITKGFTYLRRLRVNRCVSVFLLTVTTSHVLIDRCVHCLRGQPRGA